MQINDSRFLKVWKISIDQNGRKKIDLGDSKKNQDGTFTNWTWFFCNLVGNAKGIQVDEGDTITIKNGKIEQYKTNDGQYKNSITIFDFEVTAKGNGSNASQNGYGNNQKPNYQNNNNGNSNSKPQYNNNGSGGNFEDDIPF